MSVRNVPSFKHVTYSSRLKVSTPAFVGPLLRVCDQDCDERLRRRWVDGCVFEVSDLYSELWDVSKQKEKTEPT